VLLSAGNHAVMDSQKLFEEDSDAIRPI